MKNHEYDMFNFFEMTPDLVCIAGKDGFFRKVNNAVLEKLEYTEAELFGSPIASFQHPEDREITANTRAQLLEGTTLMNFENRYITKTGKTLWLHWTSIYIPDKEIVFAIAKDITVKKLIELQNKEETRKFKGLATHFKSSVEKERKAFAFALHEDLAQLAASIKLDIDMAKKNESQMTESTMEILENAANVSRLLIEKIRKISFATSPYMLEQLGLTETLQCLCDEFSTINKISCSLFCTYNEENLTHEVKLDFFRICQEYLNNVLRNSQTTSVKISIIENSTEICLSIDDDGLISNSQPDVETGFKHLQKLAALMDGNLDIAIHKGRGTTVCFTIPKHLGENQQKRQSVQTVY